MLAEVPLVGTPMLYLLRGGADVNPQTLTRFYNFHIGVVPTLFVLVLGLHILLVRLHGVSDLEGDTRRDSYPFFPDHVIREAAVGLVVLLAMVVWVMAVPPGLGAKADPGLTPTHIRPEWYFFPSYHWMKMVPLRVGLWSSAAFVGAMFLWPWIDAGLERVVPGRRIGTLLGTAFWVFTLVLLIMEALS